MERELAHLAKTVSKMDFDKLGRIFQHMDTATASDILTQAQDRIDCDDPCGTNVAVQVLKEMELKKAVDILMFMGVAGMSKVLFRREGVSRDFACKVFSLMDTATLREILLRRYKEDKTLLGLFLHMDTVKVASFLAEMERARAADLISSEVQCDGFFDRNRQWQKIASFVAAMEPLVAAEILEKMAAKEDKTAPFDPFEADPRVTRVSVNYILFCLSSLHASAVLMFMDDSQAARLLAEVREKNAADILVKLPAAKAAFMVATMQVKDVVGILGYMESAAAQKILNLLPFHKAAAVAAMSTRAMSTDEMLQMNSEDAAKAILQMNVDKAAALFADAAQKRRRLA